MKANHCGSRYQINPLEVSTNTIQNVLFDGREAKQIALAKQLAEQYGESFIPILVAGKWEELSKEMNQAVYYDQQGRMVESFKVNGTKHGCPGRLSFAH